MLTRIYADLLYGFKAARRAARAAHGGPPGTHAGSSHAGRPQRRSAGANTKGFGTPRRAAVHRVNAEIASWPVACRWPFRV